jgi:hypothetical protein
VQHVGLTAAQVVAHTRLSAVHRSAQATGAVFAPGAVAVRFREHGPQSLHLGLGSDGAAHGGSPVPGRRRPPGREAKMRDTSRKIQKINFIPSKYTDVTYRNEIKLLIEDPLPKESKESFFIQISDFVSYLVHLYLLKELKIGDYSNRIPEMITHERVCAWMQLLKSSLNLKASGGNEYGIVYYPK